MYGNCPHCGEDTINLEDYSDGPVTIVYCLDCGWEDTVD